MIDGLFWIFNALTLVSWTVLVGFPGWAAGRRLIVGLIVPAIFAVSYAVLFVPLYFQAAGGFGSVEQLLALLTFDPAIVLAAWLHFLAFDLLIGRMILEESQTLQMPHRLMIAPLLLCFMFGPVGWLAFIVVKCWKTGRF
jgi:hypothetical protein